MIDSMADGEGKIMAQKEVALAQEAMLSGNMGACGMHQQGGARGYGEVSFPLQRAGCFAICPLFSNITEG